MVGDSFSFGWLLAEEDTYVRLLASMTDRRFGEGVFHYLNASGGGWGTADYVAYVEDFADRVKPDLILVFLNVDDIGRSILKNIYSLSDANRLALERHRLQPSVRRALVQSIPSYQWLLEHSHVVQLTRRAFQSLGAFGQDVSASSVPNGTVSPARGDPLTDIAVNLGKALFRRLNDLADQHGAQLLVTTTGWHRQEAWEPHLESTRAFMAVADEYFETLRVPYLDISPFMSYLRSPASQDYIIQGDGHPNERAAGLIAEEVWQRFLEKQLVRYIDSQ